eukprot:6688304-Pyramimonas_sp.AAC.1
MPDIALTGLSQLYAVIEETLVWPVQLGLTSGRLLPKKVSGDRVIGLLSMIARIWSLAREPH